MSAILRVRVCIGVLLFSLSLLFVNAACAVPLKGKGGRKWVGKPVGKPVAKPTPNTAPTTAPPSAASPATAADNAPGEHNEAGRFLAVYLPGVHFAQIESKLEIGNELVKHLADTLGETYRLTPRIYATAEAMDADAAHIALGLLESPLVATRVSALLPLSVVAVGGSTETKLLILGTSSIKALIDLRNGRLAHAAPLDNPEGLFDNFVFEAELSLGRDHLTATRDVSSALSLASLKKADAVLLYEEDEALGQKVGLRTLYRSASLPRPTLVAFDRRMPIAEVQRLRDAMGQFHGRALPNLSSFRATKDAPYLELRAHIEKRPRRLPALVEIQDEVVTVPLPHPPQSAADKAPVVVYAPPLDDAF